MTVSYELKFIAALIPSIGVLIGVAVFGAYHLERWECEAKASAMSVQHTFGLFQGCVIKAPNGQWVPLKNYRVL